MSGGLAPSRSTVYISNLPFVLTNNDIHKILEKHGKVVKVTVLRDKKTWKSKGVAFCLFLDRETAHKCVHAMNNTQMFGRTIKCSIAKDNGRTTEFIRRKEYKDKSSCFECGEPGHLSYQCPKNLLGEREPPPKKMRKRKQAADDEGDEAWSDEDEDVRPARPEQVKQRLQHDEDVQEEEVSDEGEDPRLETLAAVVKDEQEKLEEEEYRMRVATGQYDVATSTARKKKYKKDAYFSDEEELDDD